MGLVLNVAVFALFLVLYVLWMWGNSKLFEKIFRDASSARSLLIQLPIALAQFFAFFVFIWLLSGFWSWPLVLLMIAATPLGTLVTGILWGLQGSIDNRWYSRSRWAGAELGFKHPIAFVVAVGLGLLVCIAYPIVSGISYFSDSESEQHVIRIIQYTLVALVLLGAVNVPLLIGALTSENLDENTRIRILTAQVGALIPNSLFVALLFMTFGIGGDAMSIDLIGTMSLALSIPTLLAVVGYFVLTTLIPYFIGTRRARNFRNMLLRQKLRWLSDIIQTLKTPATGYYVDRLNKQQQNITETLQSFIGKDDMIEAGIQIDNGTAPPEMKAIAVEYRKCRDMDPRFTYLDWTRHLVRRIEQAATNVAGQNTNAEAIKAAGAWADAFQSEKDDIEKTSETTGASTSPVAIITSVVITPILTVVLTGIGNMLWAVISTSAPSTQ